MLRSNRFVRFLISLVLSLAVVAAPLPRMATPAQAGLDDCADALRKGVDLAEQVKSLVADPNFTQCLSQGSSGDVLMIAMIALFIALGAMGKFDNKQQCDALINTTISSMIVGLINSSDEVRSIMTTLLDGSDGVVRFVHDVVEGGLDALRETPPASALFAYIDCGCLIAGKGAEILAATKVVLTEAAECAETFEEFFASVGGFINSGIQRLAGGNLAHADIPPQTIVDSTAICRDAPHSAKFGTITDLTWAKLHHGEGFWTDCILCPEGDKPGSGFCACPEGSKPVGVKNLDGSTKKHTDGWDLIACQCNDKQEHVKDQKCVRTCPEGQTWSGSKQWAAGYELGQCVSACGDDGSEYRDGKCQPKCDPASIVVASAAPVTTEVAGSPKTQCQRCPDGTEAKHTNTNSSLGTCEPCDVKKGKKWDSASRACYEPCPSWTKNAGGVCFPYCSIGEKAVFKEAGKAPESCWSCAKEGKVYDNLTNACVTCPQGATFSIVSGIGSCSCPEGTGDIDGVCQPCPKGYALTGSWGGKAEQCVACPDCAASAKRPFVDCKNNAVPDPEQPYEKCIECPEGTMKQVYHPGSLPICTSTAIKPPQTAIAPPATDVLVAAPDNFCRNGVRLIDGSCAFGNLGGNALLPSKPAGATSGVALVPYIPLVPPRRSQSPQSGPLTGTEVLPKTQGGIGTVVPARTTPGSAPTGAEVLPKKEGLTGTKNDSGVPGTDGTPKKLNQPLSTTSTKEKSEGATKKKGKGAVAKKQLDDDAGKTIQVKPTVKAPQIKTMQVKPTVKAPDIKAPALKAPTLRRPSGSDQPNIR